MTGIHYVTDEQGNPTAVMLDFQQWDKLWGDIYDGIIAEQRKDEVLIPWEENERELCRRH